MTDPQGIVAFPGIEFVLDASIDVGHGISPSVARLSIVPQAALTTEVGTLSFSFAGTTVEFPDCKIDYGSVERNASGEVCRLSILDRRWRWRFGQISGTYNVWGDDFRLQGGENGSTDTERTPRELATLCLEAMGESDFDVADLPDDARPSVEWDYDVPAEALAALCDELGCRVVLQLDNRVVLRSAGVGAMLDSEGALVNAISVDRPDQPSSIAVVCGPSRYQVDFRLEAVGLDEGDAKSSPTLKPIEQLSYKPAGGWERADVPYFHQVAAEFAPLAQKSVFKYYRIKAPAEIPGYDGPNGNRIDRLEQILPIENEQVAVAVENGPRANLPATVFGVWYPETGGVANSCASLVPVSEPAPADGGAPLGPVYQRPFTIDAARGLVIFEEPVYRNAHPSATGGPGYEVVVGPAQLVLRAACSVHDPQTSSTARYVRERSTGWDFGTSARYAKHEEIVLTHSPTYSDSYALVDVDTNTDEVDRMADFYLDALQRQYEDTAGQTVRYAGLVKVELDGAIQHVGFHVDGSGTTTTAARHVEPSRAHLPYRDRRRIEQQDDALDRLMQTTRRNLARTWKSSPYTKPRPPIPGLPSTAFEALVKVPFRNNDSQTVPPFGLMQVSGSLVERGVTFLACERPGSVLQGDFAVNGPSRVLPGEMGICYRQGDLPVAYSGVTPLAGESWGVRANQWTLAKGYPHVVTVLGIQDAANSILFGRLGRPKSVMGAAATDLPAAVGGTPSTATVTVYVWDGGSFTPADPAMTFTGYNTSSETIKAGTLTEFIQTDGLWVAIASAASPPLVRFELTTDLIYGTDPGADNAAVVQWDGGLSEYVPTGETTRVFDWTHFGGYGSWAGKGPNTSPALRGYQGWAVKKSDSARHEIVWLESPARFVVFRLYGQLTTATTSLGPCPVLSYWDGRDPDPTSAGITVYNLASDYTGIAKFSGDANAVGYAIWDETAGHYRICAIEGDGQRWVLVKNVSGYTMPAHSCVAVVDNLRDTHGHTNARNVLKCERPSATLHRDYLITGHADIANNAIGLAYSTEGPMEASYDTGTPTNGETWGPKPGQFPLAKGFPGFSVEGVNGDNALAVVRMEPISQLLVKTSSAVGNDAATSSYAIYTGTQGSETNSGFTAPTAYNRSGAVDADTWCTLKWINNAWELVPLVGGSTGGGGTTLYKGALTAALAGSDSAASVGSLSSYTADSAPGGTVTANNMLSLVGQSGDTCVVIRNDSGGGSPTYDLLNVQHKWVYVVDNVYMAGSDMTEEYVRVSVMTDLTQAYNVIVSGTACVEGG